jgi:chemotaxis protein histidine kinase CheA
MEVVKQHYTIDLSSNNNFVTVPAMQGDGARVRYAELELISNGTKYIVNPSDVHATIIGTKADGTQIFNPCTITNEGYILVEITQQMTAAPGRGDYQIALFSISQNTQLKSFPFFVLITRSTFDTEYLSSRDEYQELTDLETKYIEYADEAAQSAAEAAESAANADAAAREAVDEAMAETREEMQGYVASASSSATSANNSKTAAKTSEINAKTSETNAKASETNAKTSETNAEESETNAKASEDNAADSAELAESWAVGGTNSRAGEDTNNSKYYAEQAQQSLEAINTGSLRFSVSNGHLYWEPVTP